MKRKVTLLIALFLTVCSVGIAQGVNVSKYASEVSAGTYYLYYVEGANFINPTVNPPATVGSDNAQMTTLTATDDGKWLMSGVNEKYLKTGNWRGQYLWADGAEGDTKWTFTVTSEKTYVIAAMTGDYKETSISGNWYWTGSNVTDNEEAKGHYALMTEEQFAAFQQATLVEAKRTELNELIEAAAGMGIDVTAAQTVCNDENSTLEQLETTLAALKQEIKEKQDDVVTPEKPLNVTADYIANTTFEENFNGWISDTGAKNNQIQTNAGLVGEGGVTGKFYENWKGTPFDGRMYTEIENLPNGVYAFTLGAFANSENAYVYANQDRVAVEKYEDGGKAKLYTVISLVDDTKMEAGLMTDGSVTTWMGIDNAKLMYYGSRFESYKYWFDLYKEKIAYDEQLLCQKSLYEQYKGAVQAVESATTKETIVSAITSMNNTEVLLKENITAYAALGVAMNEADELLLSLTYEPLEQYYDEHMDDAADGLLSTEEMNAVVARMRELIDEARKQGTAVGGDMTEVLANPDFTEGLNGWTISVGSLKTGGNAVNPMAESWQTNFNMYQEVSGLNNGVYQLDFNGFARHNGYETSWAERANPVEMAYAYMNGTETVIKDYSADATTNAELYTSSPYTPEEGYYLPSNLNDVARGMNSGLYKNTVYGIVTEGKLRVGLFSESMGTDCWVAWDSFRLTYQGKDAGVLAKALPAIVKQMKRYESAEMSATVKNELKDAITNGESATGNGEQMFQTYTNMENIIGTVKQSIAIYDSLRTAYEELKEVSDLYASYASQSTRNDVFALLEQLESNIPAGTYTDEEARVMIETIEKMKTAVRTPDGLDNASDENPVDMTSRIINASFDKNNDEGWSGTPMAHQTVQAAEVFNTNFDIYQVITGLPEGTYEVGVTGFYRNGWNNDDTAEPYRRYAEGETANAVLYAITAEGEKSIPMTSMWADATEDSISAKGVVKIVDGERAMYVPNSMTAAVAYFAEGKYKDNSLLVKVTDGTLTIGLKKDVLIASDWTMFDSFRLTYYGKNSEKTTGIDASLIDNGKRTIDNSVYDLQGRRVKEPTKGLYIINGRKVVIK